VINVYIATRNKMIYSQIFCWTPFDKGGGCELAAGDLQRLIKKNPLCLSASPLIKGRLNYYCILYLIKDISFFVNNPD
jgi:hypothetical protein